MGIPPLEGGHEPATIGHFMGGDDAGDYSYLWAEVYALNVFARFKKDGLSHAATGAAYRDWILEQGNMKDWDVLLKGFLEKDPSMDVFYKRLHIRPPQQIRRKGQRYREFLKRFSLSPPRPNHVSVIHEPPVKKDPLWCDWCNVR